MICMIELGAIRDIWSGRNLYSIRLIKTRAEPLVTIAIRPSCSRYGCPTLKIVVSILEKLVTNPNSASDEAKFVVTYYIYILQQLEA